MPTAEGFDDPALQREAAPALERALTRLTLGGIALVLLLLLRRLPYGVDLTDEAFYIAMPYRFLLGDRPFVDEIFLHQTAALMTYPLVAGFVRRTGGTDGIVLFMRAAHLVFSVGSAILVASVLRRFVRWQYAAWIGFVCAAFVPFCIPTLSYNTLGVGLYTSAVLLGSLGIVRPEARREPAFGGALLAFAVLAYPPLGLAALAHLGACYALGRSSARRAAFSYLAGFAIASLGIAAGLAALGIENLIASVAATAQLGDKGGGAAKLAEMSSDLLYWVVLQPLPLAIAWGLGRSERLESPALAPWLPGIALCMPIALATVAFEQHSARSLWQILHLGLAAPLLLPLGHFTKTEREFCVLVLLASAFAASITAYTSANGLMNAGLGALPAALIALLALSRAAARASGAHPLSALPAASVLLILLSTYSTTTYSSATPKTSHLTSRIARGPFAGMYTYPNRAHVVARLQSDVAQHVAATDTVLFTDDLPAGYLMTTARAAANSAWTPSYGLAPGAPALLFDYYAESGAIPTVVVRRGASARREADPLVGWTKQHFDLVAQASGHTIYRRKSPLP